MPLLCFFQFIDWDQPAHESPCNRCATFGTDKCVASSAVFAGESLEWAKIWGTRCPAILRLFFVVGVKYYLLVPLTLFSHPAM